MRIATGLAGGCAGRSGSGRRPVCARIAGFTLVELIIALAITSTVLVAIAGVFVGSMRAVRSGYQTIDATEQARNAVNLIQNDLQSAFTARQFGEHYHFYGTPIGFTFIGVAAKLGKVSVSGDNNDTGLARVTYVVYLGDRVKARRFADTPPLAESYFAQGIVSREDMTRIEASAFDTTVLPPSLPGGGNADPASRHVFTFPLLRVVEPGAQDLDNFPVDWDFLMGNGAIGELQPPSESVNVRAELAHAVGDIDFLQHLPSLSPAQQQLLAAKKREIWIRMLAGDPSMPNLWDLWRQTSAPPPQLSSNVGDYIVAVNLVYPELEDPIDGRPQYSDLIRNALSTRFQSMAPWGGERDRRLFAPFDVNGNGLEDIVVPDPNDPVNGTVYLDDPGAPPPDRLDAYHAYAPFAYNAWALEEGRQKQTPYWGAEPNVPQLLDSGDPRQYAGPGSPLTPRIPDLVRVRLRFILPSPYIGAPDVVRLYTRAIDIPSGYVRKVEGG